MAPDQRSPLGSIPRPPTSFNTKHYRDPPLPGAPTLSDPLFIDLVITPIVVGVGTALFLWYFRNRRGMGLFRHPAACAAAGLVVGVANYLFKASL